MLILTKVHIIAEQKQGLQCEVKIWANTYRYNYVECLNA